MRVTLTINPARGQSKTRELDVGDGQTVKDALDKAGVATEGFNFFVGDEPVNIDQPLQVTMRGEAVELKATERARGS
jgi:sulfur carrier protein ThiS